MNIEHSFAKRTAPGSSPLPERPFTIGEMAKVYNVSQRTLRFYEDRGLLAPRRDGPSRLYDAQECRKLERILDGKRLGFTLTEIGGLMTKKGAEPVKLSLDGEQITMQIAHLERQRRSLDAAIAELRTKQTPVSPAR